MNKNQNIWLTGFKGGRIYPLNPTPEMIDIEEIALGCSREYRFSRMIKRGICYTSAEHNWHVSYLCQKRFSMAGLVHDGADYIFGDVASPLKHSKQLKGFDKAEKKFQGEIFKKYCGFADEPLNVKMADTALAMWEAENLLEYPPSHLISPKPLGIKLYCWSPEEAEAKFLERFHELQKASKR